MPDVPALTQIPTEGDKVFPEDTGNDNPAESSPGEKTNADQTQSPDGEKAPVGKENGSGEFEKDKGFMDHPAWKERDRVWQERQAQQDARHAAEIQKLREEFEAKITGPSKGGEGEAVKIPSWFGGNEDQWREFQEWNKTLVNQAKDAAIGDITAKEREGEERLNAATKYFEDTVAEIEGDKELNPEGVKVDRNKLLKVAQDFDLVDSKGNWNYKAAWRFLRNASAKAGANATDEKKILADASVKGNRAEDKPQKFMTSADFKKPGARPW